LLADIQQNIAEVHFRCEELEEAERWMNKYRPIREQLRARDPANAQWQQQLADAWRNYALLQARMGKLTNAAEAHRKGWEISEELLERSEEGAANWVAGLISAEEVFKRLVEEAKVSGDLVAEERYQNRLMEIRAKIRRWENRGLKSDGK
jgi:hypothetical protein